MAPDYLTDPGDTAQLGFLARGETGPGEAFIAQVPLGPGGRPALAVYRVFRARRSDYFGHSGADDEPLTDRGGRDIRITEGFLVSPAPADAEDLGLTTADLETAHRHLERPYRLFWETEDDYVLWPSHRITVGVPGAGSPLLLRPPGSRPPVQVPDSLSARPEPPGPQPAEDPPAVPGGQGRLSPSGLPPSSQGGPPATEEGRRLRRRIAVTAVAALVTFGAVLAVYSAISGGSKGGRSLPKTLAEVCSALDSGNAPGAYALTTPAFQAKTSEAAFSDELTGGTGTTMSCATAPASGTTTASTTLTITTPRGIPAEWTVTLARSGDSWEVSGLTSRSGARSAQPTPGE